jgi:hypothetical protein
MANPNESKLMNMLMNVPNYEKRVRPVLQENKPVFVRHGVILKDISEIVSTLYH